MDPKMTFGEDWTFAPDGAVVFPVDGDDDENVPDDDEGES